jgi:hypothetical protein
MKHFDTKRSAVRSPLAGAVLGRAAVAGGLVAVGATFGVLVSLPDPGAARAGEHNYVKSSSHEAISNVRLDEEIAILFNSAVFPSSVGPDTILIRTGATQGEQANGRFVVGRFMYDRASQRRVVIRPEAVREYYQLVKGYSREDAQRLAERTIDRIEKNGQFSTLRKIDRALQDFFGPTYGAGTRLDDETVFAPYPAPLNPGDSLLPYRERIAGDDALWQDYLVNANYDAFAQLGQNPEYERFYHRVDSATGVADAQSVLRSRTYRQVLIDRRKGTRVMFVPEIPIRADLTDTGYKTGSPYSIVIPASQPGVFNTVLTLRGHRPLLQNDQRDYSTYFTTLTGNVNSSGLFLDNEARTGLATLQKPRVINQTPPNGETFIDPTTDWEDPDNQGTTPVSARKTFTIRLRFAQPLDPRTVSPTNFTVRKTRNNPGTPNESSVDIPVAVGTFLNQHRLGIVEVEITPATNLDPNGEYEVAVKGLVKSLGGELLNLDYKSTFITGSAEPPLDAIRENFLTATNRANPNDADTLGQQTTCYWPAPSTYDPQVTGRAVHKFMPFAGTGVGAPQDPLDAQSPITQNLVVLAGQSITFTTEISDPASPDFGKQLEYHYKGVTMTSASVTAIGRYPLVIRSQGDINLKATNILVRGGHGGDGLMNTDTAGGDPTGGLGGTAGPGGYRGGDGGGAPITDQSGFVVLDGQGRLQFDQTKLDGSNGAPGYFVNGLIVGGGHGGFSGDRDFPAYDANNSGGIDPDDNPLIAERYREAGGGGGHATVGADGDGSRGSQKTDVDGFAGGLGGGTYGDGAFSTAPLNAQGVPTLDAGFGGAGGGGGGLEDDDPIGTVGPEDAGGGGGGGGGGAIQLTARGSIVVDSTTIDARGGRGGRTYNANRSAEGQGAPGGCGAGGSIWLQAYEGDVDVKNGSGLLANAFLNTENVPGSDGGAVGEITTGRNDTPSVPAPIKGKGGNGGNGYVRIEDRDGQVLNLGSQVKGEASFAVFRPEADGSYPGRIDDVPMIVNTSVAYSRWFNTQLDTPTFVPVWDDPNTPEIEGTASYDFFNESGGVIGIECRTAPNDPNNTGHPNLFSATSWVGLDQVGTISDRRFLQFRITMSLPLNYSFDNPLPYVDFLQVNIELK